MHPGRTLRHSLSLLALAGFAVATAHAQTAQAPAPDGVAAPRHRAVVLAQPAAGGLVVGIDPETGMLVMPEPERLAKLLAAREAGVRRARPAPVQHADGSISLDVHDWMREFVMASAAAGGRPSFRCVTGRAAADRARREAPAPAALEER